HCAAQGAKGVGADYAIWMSVELDRRDYAITLELIDAGTAEIVSSTSERCEVCGISEARDVVDNQAAALRASLEAATLAPPVVVFRSTPPGATIRLDGQVLGTTPLETILDPGMHHIEASLGGHVDGQRTFEAVTGVRTAVSFDLEPAPRPESIRKLRIFGWTALGVGIAGLATGATLIGIDGRQNTLDCS